MSSHPALTPHSCVARSESRALLRPHFLAIECEQSPLPLAYRGAVGGSGTLVVVKAFCEGRPGRGLLPGFKSLPWLWRLGSVSGAPWVSAHWGWGGVGVGRWLPPCRRDGTWGRMTYWCAWQSAGALAEPARWMGLFLAVSMRGHAHTDPPCPRPGLPELAPRSQLLVLWFPDLRPCTRGPASARLLPDRPPGPSVARDGLPFLGRGLRTQPSLKPHLEGLRVTKARCRRHYCPPSLGFPHVPHWSSSSYSVVSVALLAFVLFSADPSTACKR